MESIPIIDASYPPDVLTCQAWEGFEEFCFAKVPTICHLLALLASTIPLSDRGN